MHLTLQGAPTGAPLLMWPFPATLSFLALPFETRRARALDTALDAVRDRFGTTAITRAVLLGRDPGLTMPMLPD